MIMKTGKQNIIKKKLNELNEIPEGFHFDQQETWQRLEMRMDSGSPKEGLVLWFQRLIRAVSRLFAGDTIQSANRRRSRKRLNEKKAHRQI
jgi:hypothetical protein